MKKNSALFLAYLLLFCSCTNVSVEVKKNKPTQDSLISYKNNLMDAVLWQQTSAEYRALCYQAYNLAQVRLNEWLEKNKDKSKLAIVTDIDETVLDNSPYEAFCILNKKEYEPKDWDEWVNKKIAIAVPGAVDFFNYAKSKGVEVFYVSNRTANQEMATIENLKKVNLPFADTAHLLLDNGSSAKQARFSKIAENHTILMYLGDNCSDFTSKFRAPSVAKRFQLADSLRKHFGNNYIVLPNPMYGDWMSKGILQGRHGLSATSKDSLFLKQLRSY